MSDYFKIVVRLTKRGQQPTLEYSYVPHKWEQNGYLFWPQANLMTLRTDPGSSPETDWKQYKCKVKKTNICGIQEAQLWEEHLNDEGSDAENDDKLTVKHVNRVASGVSMASCSNKTEQDKLSKTVKLNPKNVGEERLVQNNTSINSQASPQVISTENFQADIEELIIKIIGNQERIVSELTVQRETSDKLYKLIKEIQSKLSFSSDATTSEANKDNKNNYNEKFQFPIDTVDDVVALDRELQLNEEFKKSMVSKFIEVGGTEGNKYGNEIARKLKNLLFTKHVLTEFSWTGISRTEGLAKKETFQSCKGLINLFLEVVSQADNRWDSAKNEEFFKYTLKHAKEREKSSVNKTQKAIQLTPPPADTEAKDVSADLEDK